VLVPVLRVPTLCTQIFLAAVDAAPIELAAAVLLPNMLILVGVVPVTFVSAVPILVMDVRHDPNQVVSTEVLTCRARPEISIMRSQRTIGRRHHPAIDEDPYTRRCIDHAINI
jgi:hypothetical protein